MGYGNTPGFVRYRVIHGLVTVHTLYGYVSAGSGTVLENPTLSIPVANLIIPPLPFLCMNLNKINPKNPETQYLYQTVINSFVKLDPSCVQPLPVATSNKSNSGVMEQAEYL